MLKEGTSVWWQVQSRNKRSVALDLRSPEGQEVVRKLVSEADVLIENSSRAPWKAGDWLRSRCWSSIPGSSCCASWIRSDGPYRDRPGFGVIGEAMGGLRYLRRARPGARARRRRGDTLAALHGVIGILLALQHRDRKRQGPDHRRRLYEAVFNCMESLLPEFSAFGAVRGPAGSALPGHRADQCLSLQGTAAMRSSPATATASSAG